MELGRIKRKAKLYNSLFFFKPRIKSETECLEEKQIDRKKLVSPQQDDGMLCLALLWSADVCRQSSTNCPRLKLLFLQAPCPAGFSYLFKGPRYNLLVVGCQQGRGQGEQEPPLILNCVPCPFCSNFMKTFRKNWSKKGFFKPFLLIYSLLPLSHLQISQLISYHLCLILLLSSFRPALCQKITTSVNLIQMHTDPAMTSHPWAQIPFYHPELVFHILDLNIPILTLTVCTNERAGTIKQYCINYSLERAIQLILQPSLVLWSFFPPLIVLWGKILYNLYTFIL